MKLVVISNILMQNIRFIIISYWWIINAEDIAGYTGPNIKYTTY